MAVSCDCSSDYDYAFYFEAESDYAPLATSKRKRCCNCKTLINIGDLSLELERYRFAENEVEERIYDDSRIYLASWYYCEQCADLYFSITEAGFCVTLDDNTLKESLKETIAAQGISSTPFRKWTM